MKSILLIGEVGAGKSSLGNFILGENFFEVADEPERCTKNLKVKASKKYKDIEVIDTAGYNDSNDYDKNNFNLILEYFCKKKKLELILMTINYTSTRLTMCNKNFIKFLSNTFPKNLCHHIAFAFTRFNNENEKKLYKNKYNFKDIRSRKNKYIFEVMKIMSEETKENLFLEPPVYFLDSVNQDNFSVSQIKSLISFTKSLSSLDVFQKKELFIKEEISEYDSRKRVFDEEDKIITETYYYIREKQIFYDGTINYTDWRCYNDDRKIERKFIEVKENEPEQLGLIESIGIIGFLIYGISKIYSAFNRNHRK